MSKASAQIFSRPQWHRAIAGLIASIDRHETGRSLLKVLRTVGHVDDICVLGFSVDSAPEVLFHTMNSRRAVHYLDRYLAGPYVLDPLYQLAISDKKPGVCRYRDETPDRFHSSEYYRRYCERTHLIDEIDYLVGATDSITVVMVVARLTKRFSAAEVQRFQQIESIVHAAITNIWRDCDIGEQREARSGGFHNRLSRCFDNFGDDQLTQREREITQLLLRGFSTKAIARHLNIAPGTVMVHKRNLFGKLEITSQYQLFSRFIESLSEF